MYVQSVIQTTFSTPKTNVTTVKYKTVRSADKEQLQDNRTAVQLVKISMVQKTEHQESVIAARTVTVKIVLRTTKTVRSV